MTEAGKARLQGVKLGVIGAGAMGGAIIRGLLAKARVPRDHLVYYDPDPAQQKKMEKMKVIAAQDNTAVMQARVVILAVKPQLLGQVLAAIQDLASPQHLIISIAAGTTLATLEAALPESRIIRAMPNTPALVAAGMTALAPGRRATLEDLDLALELFQAVGQAEVVEERLMDAVTALSGSGPAFVAVFIEALADGGVKAGLPRLLAHNMAVQTVLGAARLCHEEDLHPAKLKDLVASPAGTTIEGLYVLENGGFRGLVMSAVAAAAARAKELGKK